MPTPGKELDVRAARHRSVVDTGVSVEPGACLSDRGLGLGETREDALQVKDAVHAERNTRDGKRPCARLDTGVPPAPECRYLERAWM